MDSCKIYTIFTLYKFQMQILEHRIPTFTIRSLLADFNRNVHGNGDKLDLIVPMLFRSLKGFNSETK